MKTSLISSADKETVMNKIYKGRVIIKGETKGDAVVTRQGLNTLATFMRTILLRSSKAVSVDQNNRDLYKKNLQGKILCLPKTIGSTTAGLVFMTIADTGAIPSAMLFSERIDSLAAAGVIISDIWVGKKIITIDSLGDDFLRAVQTGMDVAVKDDGTVMIAQAGESS